MIVVESGGTKSTWVFYNSSKEKSVVTSMGLHPQELTDQKHQIVSKLILDFQLEGRDIYFFGAGCESKEAKSKITQFLEKFSLTVRQVQTDIYAACLAHLGNKEGVVGILGTGAVAARFDGHKVIQQTSGLGYLLGDEGSGFDIGKRLLQSYFKDELPESIKESIATYFNHQPILHRIYESDGRMFIAGLTKIVYDFKETPIIQMILKTAFLEFCETALKRLGDIKTVHFIGSIAFYFSKELEGSVLASGFELGSVEKEAVNNVFKFISDENAL